MIKQTWGYWLGISPAWWRITLPAYQWLIPHHRSFFYWGAEWRYWAFLGAMFFASRCGMLAAEVKKT